MGIFGSILGGLGGALLAPFTGGASIGIGAGIGNSIEDSRDAKKANAQKMGLYNNQLALAQQQFQFQQDYAKNRLQWQVEDAKKAGLHPMVAAGLSPTSFSPVSTPSIPDMSSVASDLGQNLDYAVSKAKTQKQQLEALDFVRRSNELDLEGKHLDNELKQIEIMSMLARLTNSGPAAPSLNGQDPLSLIGGQDDSVKIVPDEIIASGPNSSVTAGTHPLWTHARTGDFTMPVLSGNLADAVTENKEKNVAAEVSYALSAWNGSLKPPMNAFTRKEKELLGTGEYSAYYYPFMGWRVEPTLSWKNFRKFVLGGFRKN